jgi:hypothetical protein
MLFLLSQPAPSEAACPVLGVTHVPVRIDHAGAPVTNYFAMLELDTATPIGLGQLRPDGQDLRFSNAACVEFDYWIESGLNTTATRVWVKVPIVPTGTSGYYAHYGNLALTHVNDPSNVFGPSIASLYTFTEQAGNTVTDHQSGHDLTLTGTTAWTLGPRPGVGAVDGFGSGRLAATDTGAPIGTGSFTTFSVINATFPNGSTQGVIGSYANDGANGWTLKLQGPPGQFMLLTNEGGTWCQVSGGNVVANTWSMIGGRRLSGQTNSLFQDGANLGPICTGDARNLNGPGAFELGRAYTSQYPFFGAISFSIVYDAALDDATIAALYASLLPAVHPVLQPGTPFAGDIVVTSPDQATFTVGSAGSLVLTATGDPTPAITVAGVLPAGVTFDAGSRTLMGTPMPGTAGVYSLLVTASNGGMSVDSMQNFTLTVNRSGQTITFPNPGAQIAGTVVALVATASSALPVSFESLTPAVCTVAGASATLLGPGTCSIVARQPGDAGIYLPAPDVTQSFNVASAVPEAPTDVRVTVNDSLVTLEWTPASTGVPADYFAVEVGDAPGRTTVLMRLTRETTEVGLLPSGEYFFRVRAINKRGMSAPSGDVWARVASTREASAPPVGFAASAAGNTVSLSWRPADFGAPPDQYVLEIGSQRLARDLGQIVFPASATSVTVPNVPPGVYALRLRALNAVGYTPQAPEVLLRVGDQPACASAPERPIMLTPVISGHTVAVTWLEAPGDAPAFVLEAGSAPGANDLLTTNLGVQSGVAATLGSGGYAVRVVPQNACGDGDVSAEALLTIDGDVPGAPTDLAAVSGPGGVTFTWTAPATGPAATHYLLEAGVSASAPIVKIPVTGATTVTVPGVPPGQYLARVRSVNASGLGGASAVIVVVVH